MRIFVINPGSTTTRLALYDEDQLILSREFQHGRDELARFESVVEQCDFRMAAIRRVLNEEQIDSACLAGVAGRGGLLHPLEGGVYAVSQRMLADLHSAKYGEHPCNLGAILAHLLAEEWGLPAYIVDPVVTDELADVARLTGVPEIQRRSIFHALNQRGSARTAAGSLGVHYEKSNFIVCHMGGGVSIGAHRNGKVVEVVNALDGEGPFSPERTGGLPVIPVLDLIEKGVRTIPEMKQIILREGGLFAHLGTNDPREVLRRMEKGDAYADRIFRGLAYSISRHIASVAPALADEAGGVHVAGVVLTGGLARCEPLVEEISRLIGFLGPVQVVTGDEEMAALAAGALRVLKGTEKAQSY